MARNPFAFNRIAPIYSLFFNRQVKNYQSVFGSIKEAFDISAYQNVIDIGCGTGALCKVLHEYDLQVTGVDPAESMLAIAKIKAGTLEANKPPIEFIHGSVLTGLPFPDNHFDLAITSYVAHGLAPEERLILYDEMKRVARYAAVIYDYNDHRSLITTIVEWLEGGDYFNFIRSNKDELINQFGNLEVIAISQHAALYICKTD